jgi:hypothetical protein
MLWVVSAVAVAPGVRAQVSAAPNVVSEGVVTDDSRPLSPAQLVLFETPHLRNVTVPQTLRYQYRRDGSEMLTDLVLVTIRRVNADGSKDLAFQYFTGPRQVAFPELDHFQGNPLLMLALDRDVAGMKAALGLSASYFRNRIRESFVDAAAVSDTTISLDGRKVPARQVSVQPFAHEVRLERVASVQAKTYRFTLADDVPGMIAQIRIDTPADAALHAPGMSEQITFEGVDP